MQRISTDWRGFSARSTPDAVVPRPLRTAASSPSPGLESQVLEEHGRPPRHLRPVEPGPGVRARRWSPTRPVSYDTRRTAVARV